MWKMRIKIENTVNKIKNIKINGLIKLLKKYYSTKKYNNHKKPFNHLK
jgi:hypothetical protein